MRLADKDDRALGLRKVKREDNFRLLDGNPKDPGQERGPSVK